MSDWIPVSEKSRWPKNGQEILISDDEGNVHVTEMHEPILNIPSGQIRDWLEAWYCGMGTRILAWRRMPKPYKPK